MKLSIEIDKDQIFDAFMEALPSMKATMQMAQLYPQMVKEIGPIVVEMREDWQADQEMPPSYGQMRISE